MDGKMMLRLVSGTLPNSVRNAPEMPLGEGLAGTAGYSSEYAGQRAADQHRLQSHGPWNQVTVGWGGYSPLKVFGFLAVFRVLVPFLGGQVTLPDPNEPIKTPWGAQMTYF